MPKQIVIVDYGMGNLTSVGNALKFLGYDPEITGEGSRIAVADGIILPGVGAFAQAMRNLDRKRLIPVLTQQVVEKKVPFLGICLGMQLLAESSTEMGLHEGLGWLRSRVEEIAPCENLRVPHVGWNNIQRNDGTPLFINIPPDAHFYFDHSFHMICDDPNDVVAVCSYGVDLVASVRKGNIFAAQFHPEKSQVMGLKLLRNFLNFVESTTPCSGGSQC